MVTPPGMVTAITIVAFYYTAVFMIFWKLHDIKPVYGFAAMPFLWTGLEYIRTLSELAFPWADLGYTQSYYLLILQIVSVVSVHGLTFILVAVNVLLLQTFRRALSPEKRLTAFFASAAIVAVVLAYGWVVMPPYPEEGDLEIALLQGSVPVEVKWQEGNADYSFQLYDSLTRSVTDTNVALFVWPETSAPTYLSHSRRHRQVIGRIAAASHAYHLVGALGGSLRDGEAIAHNSCYQFKPDGTLDCRYDKMRLVPFSERVPYQDHIPFLQKKFLRKYLSFIDNQGVQWWSDFYAGDSTVLFEIDGATYAVLICFETTFPEFVRQLILDGSHFIVGITNDTWFGRSVGIHMHARMFVTRAVENRCWFARSANSGLTFIVDGYGRIRSELDLYEVGVLTGKVGLLDEFSFFTRHGDIAGRLSLLLTLVLSGIIFIRWIYLKLSSRSFRRS